MKKRLTEAGILAAVFIVAVLVFSFVTNRGNDNTTADLGMATLPGLSFSCEGYGLNSLTGYTQEMDITTMRDTITPVNADRLVMNMESYDRKISKIQYRVSTLDGKETLAESTVNNVKEQVTLSFEAGVLTEERVLTVILYIDGEKVYYYTRVISPADCYVTECLDYIYNFHENALAKAEGAGVGAAIEPDEEADNTTLQHVTIHSDYDHVTWGELQPKVEGKERWQIMEITPSYTSVKLEYDVRCPGEENETDLYRVKEFFRVRMSAGTMHLLDYDRTMDQIFDGTKKILSEKGLLLGIVSPDVAYMVNNDGTIVSFVQGNELWNYNRNTDELSVLFSFVDVENTDVRNLTDQHSIHLVGIDKKGNTTFAVYGYMNRGPHEGEVGAAVYYYNIDTNSIDEKVFIPSTKSAAIAEMEFGKLVYYSTGRNLLYVLVDGTLYEINMENHKENILVEHLEENQYVVSDDGNLIAYQTGGGEDKTPEVVVMNLDNGKEYKVTAGENESVTPLGFVYDDFVSGTAKLDDAGTTIAGEKVVPMYKLEIRSAKNKVVKTYESGSDYVLNVEIADGMLTLNRVVKAGSIYKGISPEYITNNEEKKESNISLDSYITELKETQMRLTFVDGIKDQNPKVLRPKQVLFENPELVEFEEKSPEGRYYVYGGGNLAGIYENAGYAIRRADEISGVVISSDQRYVWESGNRYLSHMAEGQEGVIRTMQTQLAAGKTPLETVNELSKNRGLNLTGCTTQEILYILNKNTPVIGMLDDKKAVILVGYNETNVFYTDTAGGAQQSVSYEQMDQMLAGSGNTLVGYME